VALDAARSLPVASVLPRTHSPPTGNPILSPSGQIMASAAPWPLNGTKVVQALRHSLKFHPERFADEAD
jgi:hypothetical protein